MYVYAVSKRSKEALAAAKRTGILQASGHEMDTLPPQWSRTLRNCTELWLQVCST